MCGLVLTVEDDRVVAVRGDDDDPFSRGFMCPKGPALVALHEDPDRVREPLRRTASGWQRIGWDEALDEAATRIHGLQRRHGRDALAVYIGNPAVHNVGAMLYGPEFLRALGTRHRYSATSVDQLPQMLAAYLMYGHQLLMPVPDVDHTQHMIVLGGNPLVSNGSIMSAPDMKRRLQALRERGGTLVVIDPRRTETAAIADRHLFVRPGSDALLLAAMLHVLFADGLVSTRERAAPVRHEAELRAIVQPFAPARVAAATGIDAATIRQLVHDFVAAESAVLYGRVGVSMHPFGSLCHWFIGAFNLLTGNLDRRGGSMFATPAFDIIGNKPPLGLGRGSFGRWRSRVRGLPEFGGELPVATLAEDIEAGGDDGIRGLVTIAGNPVLSAPNGPRLDAALAQMECVVAIDFYLNETTRHAHLLLPPTGPLEHAHYDVALHALAVHNTAKYSAPVFERGPTQRHDHEILAGLERRLHALRGAPLSTRMQVRLREQLGPERILALGLRVGPWGFKGGFRQGWRGVSMARLRSSPHGVDLGPLLPCLPSRLPSRRGGAERYIDVAPAELRGDVARLQSSLERGDDDALLLIGRRQLRSNNSWMHNLPKLMAGKPRCTLRMHPDDARARTLDDGATARVRSRVGVLTCIIEHDRDMMPGVVSLPHGFGHDREGTGQQVARAHAGVSINDLTDEQRVDAVSGVAAFSGVPVEVERA